MAGDGRLDGAKRKARYDDNVEELDHEEHSALVRAAHGSGDSDVAGFVVIAVRSNRHADLVQKQLRKAQRATQGGGFDFTTFAASDIVFLSQRGTGRIIGVDHAGNNPIQERVGGLGAYTFGCSGATRHVKATELDEESVAQVTQKMSNLRIGDSEAVSKFLMNRLVGLQQIAVKRMAKAWIKGICPRKQMHFPYRTTKNKKPGTDPTGPAPAWWPSTDRCPFVEPDHVRREHRLNLCLHLIRLRPTPEQLKAWNKDIGDPHHTHVRFGWSAFLRELCSPEELEMMSDTGKRTERRHVLLRELYEVAEKEEEFMAGGLDADYLHHWFDTDEDYQPDVVKRSRRTSVISDTDRASRPSSVDAAGFKRHKGDPETRRPSRDPALRSKTCKGGNVTTKLHCDEDAARQDHNTMQVDIPPLVGGQEGPVEHPQKNEQSACMDQEVHRRSVPFHTYQAHDEAVQRQCLDSSIQHRWSTVPHGLPNVTGWTDNPTPNTSFNSSDAAMGPHVIPPDLYQGVMPYSTFPGQQDFAFPPPESPRQCPEGSLYQVQQVRSVTQPQFADTPFCSPTSIMYQANEQQPSATHKVEIAAYGIHGNLPPQAYMMPAVTDVVVPAFASQAQSAPGRQHPFYAGAQIQQIPYGPQAFEQPQFQGHDDSAYMHSNRRLTGWTCGW